MKSEDDGLFVDNVIKSMGSMYKYMAWCEGKFAEVSKSAAESVQAALLMLRPAMPCQERRVKHGEWEEAKRNMIEPKASLAACASKFRLAALQANLANETDKDKIEQQKLANAIQSALQPLATRCAFYTDVVTMCAVLDALVCAGDLANRWQEALALQSSDKMKTFALTNSANVSFESLAAMSRTMSCVTLGAKSAVISKFENVKHCLAGCQDMIEMTGSKFAGKFKHEMVPALCGFNTDGDLPFIDLKVGDDMAMVQKRAAKVMDTTRCHSVCDAVVDVVTEMTAETCIAWNVIQATHLGHRGGLIDEAFDPYSKRPCVSRCDSR